MVAARAARAARAALGADATGPDLLSTKADGDGRYVLLNGLVLDWNIFKLLVNAASADRSDDVDDDTRIRLLSTALDLVGAGGLFSGVSLGSADTFWKWIEVGPSNLRGEMEALYRARTRRMAGDLPFYLGEWPGMI